MLGGRLRRAAGQRRRRKHTQRQHQQASTNELTTTRPATGIGGAPLACLPRARGAELRDAMQSTPWPEGREQQLGRGRCPAKYLDTPADSMQDTLQWKAQGRASPLKPARVNARNRVRECCRATRRCRSPRPQVVHDERDAIAHGRAARCKLGLIDEQRSNRRCAPVWPSPVAAFAAQPSRWADCRRWRNASCSRTPLSLDRLRRRLYRKLAGGMDLSRGLPAGAVRPGKPTPAPKRWTRPTRTIWSRARSTSCASTPAT